MLRILSIKNIAVIESTEIEFTDGFNVLTGETGAGKSIIIDSVNALLGERISRDIIRSGESKGIVCGIFDDISEHTKAVLDEYGIPPEEDGTLIISREIRNDGKNLCRINGMPAALSLLRTIGQDLIAIHGQNDTQNLYSEDKHLTMLDGFAETAELLLQYRQQYSELSDIKKQITDLRTNDSEKLRHIEMLRYQYDEIQSAGLKIGEEEILTEKRSILQSREKILSVLNCLYENFYGADNTAGICEKLSSSCRDVSSISSLDERFSALYSKLEDLKYAAEDITENAKDILDETDADCENIDDIESRLDTIYKLKRKYGSDIEEILRYSDKIAIEISNIENSDQLIKQLEKQYAEKIRLAEDLAVKLSEKRTAAANVLSKSVTDEIHELCMDGAEFAVSVSRNFNDKGLILDRNGCDTVLFTASTNRGEPAKSISKTASGGELSRIMLALKNVMLRSDDVRTMIFDEIDTGVSGRAAGSIGEKLYSVACMKQVLCVTHLAQISAFADRHLLIEKETRNDKTFTSVTPVEGTERLAELSRIISGKDITDTTLKTAKEMIQTAEKIKETYKNKYKIQ